MVYKWLTTALPPDLPTLFPLPPSSSPPLSPPAEGVPYPFPEKKSLVLNGMEPLRHGAEYRRDFEGKITFRIKPTPYLAGASSAIAH